MKPSHLFLAIIPALALALPAAAVEGDAAAAETALEQAGGGKQFGDAAPHTPKPEAPQAGRLTERAFEAARGVQRAEELLTPRQKAEIMQALERIERALRDMSGGQGGFFCSKNETGGFQIFSARGQAVGDVFSFESDCEKLVSSAKDGMVCGRLERQYQLFGSQGQPIGAGMSFASDCLEGLGAAREGFVCSRNSDRQHQLFSTAGNPVGKAFSFSSDCLEQMANARSGKVCIKEGFNYRLFGRNGQSIGGLFDSLDDCRRARDLVAPVRP